MCYLCFCWKFFFVIDNASHRKVQFNPWGSVYGYRRAKEKWEKNHLNKFADWLHAIELNLKCERRGKVQTNFSVELRVQMNPYVLSINRISKGACGFILYDLKIYIKINCPAATENTNKIGKLPRHKQTFNLSNLDSFPSTQNAHTNNCSRVVLYLTIYCLKFESSPTKPGKKIWCLDFFRRLLHTLELTLVLTNWN